MELDRRSILAGATALPLLAVSGRARAERNIVISSTMGDLEGKVGGRLGAFILDTGSGRMTGHRYGELFGMCSTFKLALAAAVLQKADQGTLKLSTELPYGAADMVPHAPVTGPNLAKGAMRIGDLAEAAQKTSDNVAANLLIRHLGGPAAVTAIFRSWGDDVTRLDRYETEMNNVPPGEERDTTTPREFARTMQGLFTGDRILMRASRELLIQWMVDTKSGARRIRAGLPAAWVSGDKTGTANSTSFNNKTNDVAIFWPPGQMPVIVTAYYEADGKYDRTRAQDEAVFAEVGRIAAARVADWNLVVD